MKRFSRDFTLKEKIIILILSLVLIVALYYFVVDRPVRNAVTNTVSEREDLEVQLTALNQKVSSLQQMQSEMDSYSGDSASGKMGSYNNSKAELDELNELLKNTESYDISFDAVTRSGNLVRRSFSLTFTASDYAQAEELITNLCEGEWRCLVSDISMASSDSNLSQGNVEVGINATFYETMVGGTADSGLPADTESTSEEE